MSNPWLSRLDKRGATGHGLKSEKRVLKGRAKPQPGSGAIPGRKGDGINDGYVIEAKSTVHASFSLKHKHLRKITEEALAVNRMPTLTVSFVRPDGQARDIASDWAVIPLALYDELTKCSRSQKD